MPIGQENTEPIHRPHPEEWWAPPPMPRTSPGRSRALPAEQAERFRAAMVARDISYEEREEGVAVIGDGWELCVVPSDAVDPEATDDAR